MKYPSLFFTSATLLVLLIACEDNSITGNDSEEKFTLSFPFSESGVVWEGKEETYTNGEISSTKDLNWYIWDKSDDGYYKLSWEPLLWHIEIMQIGNIVKVKEEGYSWIEGTDFLILEEQNIPSEQISFNGTVYITDSVTVENSYSCWDGVSRKVLVQYFRVIDASNNTLPELIEDNSVTKMYFSSEGLEKMEVCDETGVLLTRTIFNNRLDEYSK